MLSLSMTYFTLISPSSNNDRNINPNNRVFPFNYTQNILISTDDSVWPHHVEPTMALGENDEIFVGWKEATEHDGGGKGVTFTRSVNGQIWTNPYVMTPAWTTGSIQSDPWMHYFNGNLYYAYLEYPLGAQGQGQISFAHSSNQGDSWTQVRATFGDGYYADKETFSIGKDGTIYLVYSDYYSSETESYTWIKLSRSYDGGNSFIENVTINDVKGIDISAYCFPGDSGELIVVWTHYSWDLAIDAAPDPTNSTLFYDISLDYGNSFGDDKDLIPEYNATWSQRNPLNNRSAKHTIPVLEKAPIGDRLYATWGDVSTNVTDPENSWDVYMRYSDDFGVSWSEILRVNEISVGNQWNPDLEFDSAGNLHFVYFDESNVAERHVQHRIFYPDANLFSAEMQVTTESSSPSFTRPGEYMSIRLDSKDMPHVVWTDTRNGELDIYYAKGEDLYEKTIIETVTETTTKLDTESITTIATTTELNTESITTTATTTTTSESTGLLIQSVILFLIPIYLVRYRKYN